MRRFDNVPICDSCLSWKYGNVPVHDSASPCLFGGNHLGASNKTAREAIHDAGARESQTEAPRHLAQTLQIIRACTEGDQARAIAYAELLAIKLQEDGLSAEAERIRTAVSGTGAIIKPMNIDVHSVVINAEAVQRLVEAVKDAINMLSEKKILHPRTAMALGILRSALAALEKPEVKS